MLRIPASRKKQFLCLSALIALLFSIVTISFGTTIGFSALNFYAANQEDKSPPANSQKEGLFSGLLNIQTIFLSKTTNSAGAELNSTFTVNNSGDSNDALPGDGICADSQNQCTLRAAIQESNAKTGIDNINFSLGTSSAVIQLNSTLSPAGLEIKEAVNITGPGARLLTVRGNDSTLTGVIKINATVLEATNISGVTIANSKGYGINNEGNLNLSEVNVRESGFGIYNSGKLNLTKALINNNTSGGVYLTSSSEANISNATITKNLSSDNGGGINSSSANLTLNNVTISDNSAAKNGGGLYYAGQSLGVYVRNTIIAKNIAPTGPDIFSAKSAEGGKFVSNGNNLIGKNSENAGFTNQINGDKVGTIDAPVDPLFGQLQNNGGQTDTQALRAGSPAKDAGNNCVADLTCPTNNPSSKLATDQRGNGFPRKFESGVDIGAFESFYPIPEISQLNPNSWEIGKGSFELVVFGSNFVADSIVKWNGQERATIFVSNNQLKAQIPTSDAATAGKYPVTVVNPQPNGGPSAAVDFTITDCSYSLSAIGKNFEAAGGSGSFNVTTSSNCSWTATSSVSWITISNNAAKTGSGAVNFSVVQNTGSERSGTITVNGQTFTITQAAGCTFILSATSANIPASGGTGSFSVTASNNSCTWTVNSNVSWITVTGNPSRIGGGAVQFTVEANFGANRSGAIFVNGQTFTVNQDYGCAFTLSASSQNFAAVGGSGSFTLNATSGSCAWSATSSVSWITITNGASGSGSGIISFSVAANSGPARSGTISVGGRTFTVTQDNGCTFTLTPENTGFVAAGGSGSFSITTNNAACQWTAAPSDSWITINGSASGNGNGVISFMVAENISPARVGKITVGGKTFTITQENGCRFSVYPTSANVPASAYNGAFNVNTGAGCQWTAQSNAAWITVSLGSSGSGGGVIAFSVAANNGPERSGTITVNGQTFTVNQANGCTFALSTNLVNISADGATNSVTVTASNSGCKWTAAANTSWITITSGSNGTGNGAVTFSVSANTSPERSGTIIIAGQRVDVIQANGCKYNLSPISISINENGGSRSFNISAGVGCPWTATSNDSWISISSGSSGTGNGIVAFSVQANTGDERQGTISAGGKIFTVSQINLIVKNLNDSGAGSLRQAVINANRTPGDDVITFQPSLVGFINLTGGEIEIANNGALEIKGPGTAALNISGNNVGRIFYIKNANVSIANITLLNGNGMSVNNKASNGTGGAIYVSGGSLTLNRVQIVGNTISSESGGAGGGIYFDGGGDHLIQNSLIYNNTCSYGAGIFTQFSNLTVANSTISGNIAKKEGGGIYSVGNTTLRNATISGNSSLASNPLGAGVSVWGGILRFGNTIISENNGPEISFSSGQVGSDGNNLIGDTAGDSSNTVISLLYQSTDILDKPPMLAPLANYGGTTTTHALFAGSPAINKGNNELAAATDQRGSARIVDGVIDIGAFENNVAISPSASALPNGALNVYYSQSATASRLGADPINSFLFTLIDGSLPPGLVFSANGLIQGSPTANGAYVFTIKATGTDGMASANKYTISVGCSYSLDATSQSFNASGGSGTIKVTGENGCAWTATSNASWITISSGANGSGNGAISFSVAANTGPARSGTISVGEKVFTVNQQTGSCAYLLSAANTNIPASGGNGSFNIGTEAGCAWTAATTNSWITITAGGNGTGNGTISFSAAANTGSARIGAISAGGRTFEINQAGKSSNTKSTACDFDGDGKADISVFRPTGGFWYLLGSQSGFTGAQFGDTNDKIVPADYDGDGKTDIAVYRAGTWYLLRSRDGFTGIAFGASEDIPVPADFDGDGKADVAVFRPSNGTWYLLQSTAGFTGFQFGVSTDKPVAGDYDGDGKADIAVFRPNGGFWYIQRSALGFTGAQFGDKDDKPVAADYDGDGKTDIAVFRPSNGAWYLQQSAAGFAGLQFGASEDRPVQNAFVR